VKREGEGKKKKPVSVVVTVFLPSSADRFVDQWSERKKRKKGKEEREKCVVWALHGKDSATISFRLLSFQEKGWRCKERRKKEGKGVALKHV